MIMQVKGIFWSTLCLFLLLPGVIRAQWVEGTTPYQDYTFLSLAVMGNNLIAACGGEVFRSTDLGNTWLDANNGIEYTSDVFELYPFGSDLFVLTIYNIGLAISEDTAQTWQPRNDRGYLGENMSAIVSFGDTILVNEAGPGLFRSTDTGNTWAQFPSDTLFPSDQNIRTLTASNGFVYAGCNGGGIFRSSDGGASWKNVLLLPSDTPVYCMAAMGNYVFAGVGSRGSSGYLYRSTNSGQTWNIANTGLPFDERPGTFFAIDSSLFVGFSSGGSVYRSNDSGSIWSSITDSNAAIKGNAFAAGWGYLFVAGGDLWRRPLSDFNNLGVVSSNVPNSTSISVFPNPATQTLHVMPGPSGTLRLFDLLSRECCEVNDDGSGATLDVSNLESGIYFLRMGSQSEKVEIMH
jgi:photosystem II stability/assembly factor-like uncharacterized protein